jgi:hypothetical protein
VQCQQAHLQFQCASILAAKNNAAQVADIV